MEWTIIDVFVTFEFEKILVQVAWIGIFELSVHNFAQSCRFLDFEFSLSRQNDTSLRMYEYNETVCGLKLLPMSMTK